VERAGNAGGVNEISGCPKSLANDPVLSNYFPMATAVKAWTDEELMALEHPGLKCELIDGELLMSPTGYNHEHIGARLLARMINHAERYNHGSVCGSSFGCRMNSGNLLSPDISFIRRDRLPATPEERKRFFQGAPDIVVEVLSPWDRTGRVHEKMEDYFLSGARLLWVVNPEEKTILVYHTPYAPKLLTDKDALDGEDILPGFRLPVSELFGDSNA
jgi:Uma2 family endonuclease